MRGPSLITALVAYLVGAVALLTPLVVIIAVLKEVLS